MAAVPGRTGGHCPVLVERVEVGPNRADILLRVAGLTSLMRELRGSENEAQGAAA